MKQILIILIGILGIALTAALILRPLHNPLTPAEQYALNLEKSRKNCIKNGHGVLVVDKYGEYACSVLRNKGKAE